MKTILIFILLGISTFVNSQQIIKVIDKTDLQPISNVEVWDGNKASLGSTNEKGELILPSGTNGSLTFSHSLYGILTLTTDEIATNGNTISLSPQIIRLDEVVVGSSRFEEKKEDVPKKVDVIYSRDIEKSNSQTTADLMQSTGNVNIQRSQQGGGSPVIRGFETNKVLIVVDGIRMNNAIYRGGHLQNVIRLDNNSLDKLEIVYGPGSVMYGSDALGGVMHFYTKGPKFGTADKKYVGASAYVRSSTANQEKTGHVDFTLGTKNFSSVTSFTFSDFGDLRQGARRSPFMGQTWERRYYVERIGNTDVMIDKYNDTTGGKMTSVNVQTQSGYSQYNLIQKLAYKSNSGATHLINFQYSNSSNVYRYDRLTDVNGSGVLKSAEWYYGPEKHLIGAYQFTSGKATKLYDKMNISLAYQNAAESRVSRSLNSTKRKHQLEEVDVYNLNVDLMKIKGKHEMRYGIEGGYNKVASRAYNEHIDTGEEDSIATRYPQGGSTYTTSAAYFTHTMEVNEKFIFTDGIRFNYVGLEGDFGDTSQMHFPYTSVSQKSSNVNGSIGFIYKPCAGWRINMMAATGFRAPNVDDVGKVFDSSPGRLVVPNNDLKPENTYNLDLGIQKSWSNVYLSVGGYYTMIKNLISVKDFTYEGSDSIIYDGTMSKVQAAQNTDQAYIYGLNAEIRADINEKFSIYTTINYTYGRMITDSSASSQFFKFTDKDDKDTPLDHIPPVFGKTSFQYNLKKFTAEFYVIYNGWKRLNDYSVSGEDNLNYATPLGMPAWYTLNIRTGYQITKNMKLQLAMENILDANYRGFSSGISAPGRNFIVTLRGNF